MAVVPTGRPAPSVLVIDGSNLSHMCKSASKATLARINAAATQHTHQPLDDRHTCSHAWFFQHWLLYLHAAFGARPSTTVVTFDSPLPTRRMQSNPNYLAARHRKQRAPPRATTHRNHLLHGTAVDAGCIVAYPQHGWDADDAIACIVAHALEQQGSSGHGDVVVASADEDMCGVVVDPRVVWAQLALPGQPSCPLGLTVWTRDALQVQLGYPPQLHGDLLAMTGW